MHYRMENKKQLEEFIKEFAPSSQLDTALCYAETKVRFSARQKDVAELLGISDRTLRSYCSTYKAEFEARIAELEAEIEPEIDINNHNRILSEQDLDKFIQSLIKSATGANSDSRSRQQFIDFFQITAQDVMQLSTAKTSALRWWLRGNIAGINKYMDSKELGISLQQSPYLYHADKESIGASEKFVNASLEDEAFKKHCMLMGLTFMSLYNNVEHPELKLMQTIQKLDYLEADIKPEVNKNELKAYSNGQDIVKDDKVKKVTTNTPKIEAMLAEMDELTSTFSKVKASEYKDVQGKALQLVKPPVLPEVEQVEQKANEHFDEIQVLLSAEDTVRAWMNETTRKNNK